MTINARLQRLVLSSPHLEQMAQFYAHAFDYRTEILGDECRCEAANRSLWIRRGCLNQVLESHFALADPASFERYAEELTARGVRYGRERNRQGDVLKVRDPDGREVWFLAEEGAQCPGGEQRTGSPSARLQHYAVRTPAPQKLFDYYTSQLGFTPSDLVRDSAGELTAAFLRTGSEHHVLAIFRAPHARFDHLSCETHDWNSLRDWADHLARRSVKLVWGVGRHGPGNDTFFMVHDADSNLVEISSDLEICAEDRPVGVWEHRMETLNQWGVAIMRS
jgi:catechol 2,3-dioxygenase